MAKTVKEYIDWNRSPETRSWKRKLQVIEIGFIIILLAATVIGFYSYEGPKKFEAAFYLFGGCLLVSSVMLSKFILNDINVPRYVRWCVLMALISGGGLLSLFAFTTLVLMKNAV